MLRVMRVTQPHGPADASDANHSASDELIGRVTSIRLTYLTLDGQGQPRWQDHWDRKNALPLAVRVRFSRQTGAGAVETDHVVSMLNY